ncbi:MAG TPA: hypothetical protein VHL58_12380 [Thermoanaerobaculia bacterium]|nr:hypothetical protein [Thermoanaerobaculia bacterium]
MDAFESVIAAILERKGYWVQTSVKVELTKEQKREIGKPSSPRWELDVVAYKGAENELLAMECKSFLDSPGVRIAGLDASDPDHPNIYKLFVDETLRRVVLGRLVSQMVERGFCRSEPTVKLGLAAGKIHGEVAALQSFFDNKGWTLWTPEMISDELSQLAQSGYDNSVAAVVSKLILRDSRRGEVGLSGKASKKEAPREAASTSSRYQKYDVRAGADVERQLNKRETVHRLVRALWERGVRPEQMSEAVPGYENRLFCSAPGRLTGETFTKSVQDEYARSGKTFDPRRFSIGDDELIYSGGRTWALTNQVGSNTEEMLEQLMRRFPAPDVKWERSRR